MMAFKASIQEEHMSFPLNVSLVKAGQITKLTIHRVEKNKAYKEDSE